MANYHLAVLSRSLENGLGFDWGIILSQMTFVNDACYGAMVAKFGNLLAGHISFDIVRENTVLPYSFGSWWNT